MLLAPFYDPEKSYEENFEKGPFGAFADDETIEKKGGKREGGGNASALSPARTTLAGLARNQYDFLEFKVNSPFGIPAGPLINGKFVQAALDKSFDICVYKTVRSEKYPCHPWPNVLSVKVDGDLTLEKAGGKLMADRDYREPLSITNSFGVPSAEPEFWQKDLARVVKNTRAGQIVVGSFQGTKKETCLPDGQEQSIDDFINDFRVTAKMLKDTGVKVIEVNFSCPNEGSANLLCYDVERSVKIAQAIKEVLGKTPLIIKIAYYKDSEMLKNFVKEIGGIVEGISAINTIAAEIVDENGRQALPGEGRSRSGVCGSAIKWAGLDMVKKLKKLREEFGYNFKIIGVGGVMNLDDFFEYKEAGADFVMSATAAMWNPYLAKEIKERIR